MKLLVLLMRREAANRLRGGDARLRGGDAGDMHGVAVLISELNRFSVLVGQLDRVPMLISQVRHLVYN